VRMGAQPEMATNCRHRGTTRNHATYCCRHLQLVSSAIDMLLVDDGDSKVADFGSPRIVGVRAAKVCSLTSLVSPQTAARPSWETIGRRRCAVKWWPLPKLPTPGAPRVLTTGDEGTVKPTDKHLSWLARQFPLQRELAGKPPKESKNKPGRKKKMLQLHLRVLRAEIFRLLDEYGDPDSPDADSALNSREKIIDQLQLYAQNHDEKIFMTFEEGYPSRRLLQPLVNDWIEEWRAKAPKG
jgi:hypothetical protein